RSRIRRRGGGSTRAGRRRSFLKPLGNHLEHLVTVEVVERLVVSARQHAHLAQRGRFLVQLLTAGGIDQSVIGAGEDQKRNPDLGRSLEIVGGGTLPLVIEAARDLAVDKRVGAVSLHDLWDSG